MTDYDDDPIGTESREAAYDIEAEASNQAAVDGVSAQSASKVEPRQCRNCFHYQPDDCLSGGILDCDSSWLLMAQHYSEYPDWQCPRRYVTTAGAANDLKDAMHDFGRAFLGALRRTLGLTIGENDE